MRRRAEIHGLRGLAIAMVVLHHVWTGRVSGGIDAFLLIGAFLLTLSFVRARQRDDRLSPTTVLLGRFRRLVPPLAVAVIVTALASRLLLWPARWNVVFDQAFWSLLYAQNVHLAATSVDYYAQDHSAASPLQHLWSLSMQGQVIVAFTLLLSLLALIRSRRIWWIVTASVLTVLTLASAAYSVISTASEPGAAYFDTAARFWEFTAGALLALLVARVGDLPRAVAVPLGWAGLGALVSGAWVLHGVAFPGVASWWPVLATAAVILAGEAGGRLGAAHWLSARPMSYLADRSYGLYLWHWPVLVIWLDLREIAHVTLVDGVGVLALSLVLAEATHRWVEQPLARSKKAHGRRRQLVTVLAPALAVLLAVSLGVGQQRLITQRIAAQPAADNPGARVFEGAAEPPSGAAVRPAADELTSEWADWGSACVDVPLPEDPPVRCGEFAPDPASADQPTRTVMMVGDSHVEQWITAMEPLARANHWRLITLIAPGCRYGGERDDVDPSCNEANAVAEEAVLGVHPDAVFTVGTRTHTDAERLADGSVEEASPAYAEGVRPFLDHGIEVVAMRDNPRFDFIPPECVDRYGAASPRCDVDRAAVLAPESPQEALRRERGLARLGLMDLTDVLCSDDRCHAVIGNVSVYIDEGHLSRTYVASAADEFARQWWRATGWSPAHPS